MVEFNFQSAAYGIYRFFLLFLDSIAFERERERERAIEWMDGWMDGWMDVYPVRVDLFLLLWLLLIVLASKIMCCDG
jgi:hypothetical protein